MHKFKMIITRHSHVRKSFFDSFIPYLNDLPIFFILNMVKISNSPRRMLPVRSVLAILWCLNLCWGWVLVQCFIKLYRCPTPLPFTYACWLIFRFWPWVLCIVVVFFILSGCYYCVQSVSLWSLFDIGGQNRMLKSFFPTHSLLLFNF